MSAEVPEAPSPQGAGASGTPPRLGVVAIVAIMLSACLGGGVVTALYQLFFAPDPPDPPKTTTVIRSTPSVITAIHDLARLEGAHRHHRRFAQLSLLRADYPRGPVGMSTADTPVIELKNVHKRFEQRPDLAQRILALTGRPIDRRTVYAGFSTNQR